MAQFTDGGNDPVFNGGTPDDSPRYQLGGIRVNGDQSNGHQTESRVPQQKEPVYVNSHSFMNGSASESELLQHLSETINNFSLSPRPPFGAQSDSAPTNNSSTASSPTNLPAVAPKAKPSKTRTQHPNHRDRSNSSGQMGYQFHVSENDPKPGSPHNGGGDSTSENRTLRFVGKRGLSVGGDDITSAKGTVRGVTNRVKAGIMNFTYKPLNHKKKAVNNDDERDKIIMYTTSMRIVRQTFEDCQFVRKLFQNHRVKYEERDLFMNSQHQQELGDRLEGEAQEATLPIVFIDGELVGDIEKLEELNETGQLRKILERFEKNIPTSDCSECGGFRYMPCQVCSGSKRSLHRNNFTDQFQALRCSNCDENGLQRCMLCNK
ncbi:glutaredoxin domain-containing cysteine-rich protein 1-like [Patiria miniata]|uniref:Glutaredoxin domain-containing protein n=1 Tax=Patiria miniata TaxID=46514 RepID=A0A913ZZ91_PATMI|nr:glutaredoxin domain-containing cysteine-rich protein 1-like [Patiria miniata]